ncbi:Tetratricopeptide TPR_2 repeat protein [Candidatus Sulfopaludibacter sp. SbA3]|nr:Tetratricopeptide TPR_2 repeat protein [Candidatus Sulfopaludibacter sp. SbA3]
MLRNIQLLLRLVVQPADAMSQILDRGSLLFASLAALAAGLLSGGGVQGLHFSFYTPLLVLAIAYVPGVLLLSTLLGRLGSIGMVFQRDYSTLLTCTAMAWAASQIPFVVAAQMLPPQILVWPALACVGYFAVLMFFAVRTVFGTGNGVAAGVVSLSWLPLVALAFLWGPLSMILRWVASPFFLFFAWYYLGSEFQNLGSGFRSRQNFQRMLEAAAVNPHDGDAQYQLGLIYQQRRRYSDAIQRFSNAVAIDPTETDAHYQLGRIAMEQGRVADAIAHFEAVLKQDERHSSSEIHRDLGSAYLAAERLGDARRELEIYAGRREYDPEGLYWYGRVMERFGDKAAARALYVRAVEAARTAPRYRRRFTAKWSRLAQKEL